MTPAKICQSLLILLGFVLTLSSPAEAKHRHHHRHHAVHHNHVLPGWAVTKHSAFHQRRHAQAHGHRGVPHLNVAPAASAQFTALAADFRAMGYDIGTPGCLSSGHMRNSKHHWGGACDLFNQIARNRTALRQPPPSVQISVAESHGLTSGCVWRNPDCGHFEVPGKVRLASSHYGGRRVRHAWN